MSAAEVLQVTLTNDLYPKKAILAAREAYASYLTVTITPGEAGRLVLQGTVLPPYAEKPEDRAEVWFSFLNYALDESIAMLMQSDTSL